ncbi:uncharacterized protein BCR38DRAFT_356614 [Pseudomassariella vexata]|uniref:Oxysterol-binding protein n=1 Tax=Pseudomassariella vexata TaxID=1141098 RepID=A0A1Y2D8W9_9PEZI|nr:uncharacterized protein BCR38DRAFT_356614 [Pseudomassariella vexata]ORY55624.1 hypothetical protein BCR38DRAFT_356614 [Pseudomassariella vexata]
MRQQQSNVSQLKDFLGYLATVKDDLSNVTAPPFVLSPKSVTEIPASWAERHKLFLQPSCEEDPAQRAFLVLKNFLCSLKRQVYPEATADSDGGAKKPLNAFLGELFLGTFEEPETGSKTQLISEQVSHHPPVTACVLYNKQHRMSSSGYVAQETTFSPTSGVTIKQIGHAIIRDGVHGESHLMTLPTMSIKGLIKGQPYPELEGTCYISSSSGFLATIDFECKRTMGFGSKRNSVRAELSNLRGDKEKLYKIDGQWNDSLKVVDCATGQVAEEFHVDGIPLTELSIKPVEQQDTWESRRAWGKVADAILASNLQRVNDEKKVIEEGQRAMREAEAEGGIEWPRLFFRNTDRDQEFEVLSRGIPVSESQSLEQDRTAGVWKFIGVSEAEALLEGGIYHKELEPTGQVPGK